MPDAISTLKTGGVNQVIIDRPPVNALDLEAITALREAFTHADRGLPVILTGAGSTFSAGVDTRAFGGYAPAQKAEIIRHEMEPNLLRRLTMTSETIDAEALARYRIADRLVPAENLLEAATATALETASQPAFAIVKRQMRGGLIEKVQALAASGEDPLTRSFLS